MQGKIVSVDEFKAVGMTYFGDNNNGEIPKMWQIFNQKFMEISNISKPVLFYGICDSDMDEQGRFDYAAAVGVDSFENVPETMVTKTIPAGNYLVYTYEGDIKNLGEFYGKIFETYLPQSGHEMDMRPQLEVYDDRFMKTGAFDIYIPVK